MSKFCQGHRRLDCTDTKTDATVVVLKKIYKTKMVCKYGESGIFVPVFTVDHRRGMSNLPVMQGSLTETVIHKIKCRCQ